MATDKITACLNEKMVPYPDVNVNSDVPIFKSAVFVNEAAIWSCYKDNDQSPLGMLQQERETAYWRVQAGLLFSTLPVREQIELVEIFKKPSSDIDLATSWNQIGIAGAGRFLADFAFYGFAAGMVSMEFARRGLGHLRFVKILSFARFFLLPTAALTVLALGTGAGILHQRMSANEHKIMRSKQEVQNYQGVRP